MMSKILSILILLLATFTVVLAVLNSTDTFVIVAHNSSAPAVDGKSLWIHLDGSIYLDAGDANPIWSEQLKGYLSESLFFRPQDPDPDGPTGPAATQAFLNFET
jgi:hypothetical protein